MNLRYIPAVLLFAGLTLAGCSDNFSSLKESGFIISTENEILCVSPSAISVAADGGDGSVTVTSGGDWEILEMPAWITADRIAGSGNTPVVFTAEANITSSTRTAVVSLRRTDLEQSRMANFVISQEGAAPHFDLNGYTDGQTVNVNAKAQTLVLPTTTNMTAEAFKVTSSQNWIKPVFNGSEIRIDVDANDSGAAREAWVYVVNNSFTTYYFRLVIKQSSASASSESKYVFFDNTGGSSSVNISTELPWTAVCDATWLEVTPPQGQAGNATLTFTAIPNYSVVERSTEVFVRYGQSNCLSFIVSQKGSTLSSSTKDITFNEDGGTVNTKVTSNIAWEVTSKPDWITVSPSAGNSGETAISVSATENNQLNDRTGKIVISDKATKMLTAEIRVTQKAINTSDGKTLTFNWKEGSQDFKVRYPGTWRIAISDPWISVSPMTGTGSSLISVSVTRNDREDTRTGLFTILSEGYSTNITVTQAGQFLTITPQTGNVSASGDETVEISVSSSFSVEGSVIYPADVTPWVNLTDLGKNTWRLKPDYNNSSLPRSCEFRATPTDEGVADRWTTGVKMELTQEGRCLTASTTAVDFISKGGTSPTYTVNATGNYSAEQSADTWFVLEINRDARIFSVYATPNNSGQTRTGSITFRLLDLPEGETKELVIPVRQIGGGVDINIDDFNDPTIW